MMSHRLSPHCFSLVHSYEGFFLSCSLTHGGNELCAPQHTSKQSVSKYLFHLVVWDQR